MTKISKKSKKLKLKAFRLLPMNKQTVAIKIEGKTYDVTLGEEAEGAISKALLELGDHIGAKGLLEAYLTKAAYAEKLQNELRAIEATIDALAI
jgi:hypothetical protein